VLTGESTPQWKLPVGGGGVSAHEHLHIKTHKWVMMTLTMGSGWARGCSELEELGFRVQARRLSQTNSLQIADCPPCHCPAKRSTCVSRMHLASDPSSGTFQLSWHDPTLWHCRHHQLGCGTRYAPYPVLCTLNEMVACSIELWWVLVVRL
jgi:hypothetical protein